MSGSGVIPRMPEGMAERCADAPLDRGEVRAWLVRRRDQAAKVAEFGPVQDARVEEPHNHAASCVRELNVLIGDLDAGVAP